VAAEEIDEEREIGTKVALCFNGHKKVHYSQNYPEVNNQTSELLLHD
jgi:hypothetical protein